MSILNDVVTLIREGFYDSDFTIIETNGNTTGIISNDANDKGEREVFMVTVKPAKLSVTEKED